MKIKNYTTEVAAIRSIQEIEQLLSENGATHIMKEYRGDQRVFSLTFSLNKVVYKLPANSEKVGVILKKQYHSRHQSWIDAQAERVAWRVIRDWLHAQLSLIQIGQAELEQIMLPYAFNGKITYYEHVKSRGGTLAMLPAPKEEEG